jgi:hypothetical protein
MSPFKMVFLIHITVYIFALYSLSPSISLFLLKMIYYPIVFLFNNIHTIITMIKYYGIVLVYAYRFRLIPRIDVGFLFPKPPVIM